MQTPGSQADSARKPLRLRHVPRSAACRRLLAAAVVAAKLKAIAATTRRSRKGMDVRLASSALPSQKGLRHGTFSSCACCAPPFAAARPARRNFLAGGLAALGLGTAGRPARAQAPAVKTRIDVHHHYMSPAQGEAMAKHGGQAPKWTLQASLADMEKAGVTTAVLSLPPPGVWFGDVAEGRALARASNEYGAKLRSDNPGRFGLFAAIPLPDTEGSLREIAYALDELKADGIGLMTSYGDRWPGDPAYAPIFEELNRRKATVYIHPTAPNCCRELIPFVPYVFTELPHDTTRAITSLLFSGSLSRFPDVRFIFSHAGGTLPMVAGRISRQSAQMKDLAAKVPNGVEYELRRLYYEIAGSANRPAIAALTNLVPMSQILFGSDYPWGQIGVTADAITRLGLSEEDIQAIGRGNAIALMPRWKT